MQTNAFLPRECSVHVFIYAIIMKQQTKVLQVPFIFNCEGNLCLEKRKFSLTNFEAVTLAVRNRLYLANKFGELILFASLVLSKHSLPLDQPFLSKGSPSLDSAFSSRLLIFLATSG